MNNKAFAEASVLGPIGAGANYAVSQSVIGALIVGVFCWLVVYAVSVFRQRRS
jgi:hypothetical protein